mmetsp:Transcript_11485/g.30492  ORF Transcript_11485/g.30492 Transcript_11485/m.30492 type:complete len:1191 (+) Transcript_11485:153-3725(+)
MSSVSSIGEGSTHAPRGRRHSARVDAGDPGRRSPAGVFLPSLEKKEKKRVSRGSRGSRGSISEAVEPSIPAPAQLGPGEEGEKNGRGESGEAENGRSKVNTGDQLVAVHDLDGERGDGMPSPLETSAENEKSKPTSAARFHLKRLELKKRGSEGPGGVEVVDLAAHSAASHSHGSSGNEAEEKREDKQTEGLDGSETYPHSSGNGGEGSDVNGTDIGRTASGNVSFSPMVEEVTPVDEKGKMGKKGSIKGLKKRTAPRPLTSEKSRLNKLKEGAAKVKKRSVSLVMDHLLKPEESVARSYLDNWTIAVILNAKGKEAYSEAKFEALRALGSMLKRVKTSNAVTPTDDTPRGRNSEGRGTGSEDEFNEEEATIEERVSYWHRVFTDCGLTAKVLEPPKAPKRDRSISIRKMDKETKKLILKQEAEEKMSHYRIILVKAPPERLAVEQKKIDAEQYIVDPSGNELEVQFAKDGEWVGSSAEKVQLTHRILTAPKREGGCGLKERKGKGGCSFFALHDHDFNQRLIKTLMPKWYFSEEDFTSIRAHFGDDIAFYFAFLQQFSKALIVPSIVGVLMAVFDAAERATYRGWINSTSYFDAVEVSKNYSQIYEASKLESVEFYSFLKSRDSAVEVANGSEVEQIGGSNCSLDIAAFSMGGIRLESSYYFRLLVLFALFMTGWSFLFLGKWRQRQNTLFLTWGVNTQGSSALRQMEVSRKWSCTLFIRSLVILTVEAVFIGVLVGLSVIVVVGEMIVMDSQGYFGPELVILREILKILYGAVHGTIIQALILVSRALAKGLTKMEKHNSPDSFERASNFKAYVFSFVAAFAWFFMQAFVYIPWGAEISASLFDCKITPALDRLSFVVGIILCQAHFLEALAQLFLPVVFRKVSQKATQVAILTSSALKMIGKRIKRAMKEARRRAVARHVRLKLWFALRMRARLQKKRRRSGGDLEMGKVGRKKGKSRDDDESSDGIQTAEEMMKKAIEMSGQRGLYIVEHEPGQPPTPVPSRTRMASLWSNAKQEVSTKSFSDALFESKLVDYDRFWNYHAKVVQFAFVSMFSIVWPVAPLPALLINFLHMRTQLVNLCRNHKRPIPVETNGIGHWLGVMYFTAALSLFVNVVLLVYTLNVIEAVFNCPADVERGVRYRCLNLADRTVVWAALEHIFIIFAGAVTYLVPSLPSSVKSRIQDQATRV